MSTVNDNRMYISGRSVLSSTRFAQTLPISRNTEYYDLANNFKASSIASLYYSVYVNGTEISAFRYQMIKSLKFEDTASGSDMVTIVFSDPELKFLADDIFIEDATIKVIAGWQFGECFVFDGYISVIDVNFPEDGIPTMTLQCMDLTHLMNRETKKKTWDNVSASDVARSIFSSYGLTCVTDTTEVQDKISQSDTDISFLNKLAEDEFEEFICYVEGRTGYFVKKDRLAPASAYFDYRCGNGECVSFSPRVNKQTKQVKASSSNVNLYDNKVDNAEATNTTTRDLSGEAYIPSNSTSPSSVTNSSSGGSWVYKNGTWVQQ